MSVESDLPPITAKLLDWYATSARDLPWRAPPGSRVRPDPYHVWLSEVMLQQTTVAAVRPYFEQFTARWPSVAALAAAEDADILAAWAGLGYYSRARNLIAAARNVMADHDGRFPGTAAELRTLPGIGDYTAAAIAAFAYGADTIPIDANLERVLARLFLVETPLPQAKAELTAHARTLWPAKGGGDFAQALMDLGARICITRKPRCELCPLAELCSARAQGNPERLPVKPTKRARPEKFGQALWIQRNDAVWLIRRPAKGLLGGMRALPGGAWQADPLPATHDSLGTIRHIFTHFALTLAVHPAASTAAVGEGEWWPLRELDAAGLPTLYRRAAELALAHAQPA
jgi:A/G-specific adenine glycosylase